MLIKLKFWTMCALTWVALRLSVYYVWSKVYRAAFERKRKPLAYLKSTEEVQKHLRRRYVYGKDGWKQLWDAVSHPEAVEYRMANGLPGGDCDDASIYIAAQLDRIKENDIYEVGLLSVPWMDKYGKLGGHNVCVFKGNVTSMEVKKNELILGRETALFYMSNWNRHDIMGNKSILQDVVDDVLEEALGTNNGPVYSLGWAYATPGLRLVCYGGPRKVDFL
jgi:hypothetical protein